MMSKTPKFSSPFSGDKFLAIERKFKENSLVSPSSRLLLAEISF